MKVIPSSAMSLMNKIITYFVGYMIVIMFLFSTMIYFVSYSSMKSVNDGYSQDVATLEAIEVRTWLDDTVNELKSISSMIETQNQPIFNALTGLKTLQQQNKDLFRHLYLVDSEKNYVDTFDQQAKMNDGLIGSVLAGEKAFIFTNPTMHPVLGEALMNMIVPIYEDDSIVGALGATVTMNELSARLNRYKVNGAGFGWLLDENYTVIAHPNKDLILTATLLSESEIVDKKLEGLNLKPFSEYGYKSLDAMNENIVDNLESTLNYQDEDGYYRTASFAPVKGSEGWTVVFTTFNDRIPNTTNTLLIYMAIGLLIIVLISIGLSYYLANELTKPINQLIHVMNLFIGGNKGVRANVKTSGEIGNLGKAFNTLADQIVVHTDNVEELIQERTRMLADLNYQIVVRNKELNTMNEELETTNSRLHSLATTDMLTGLQNRHELMRTLQGFMDDVLKGDDTGFAILFVDLDNFKYYNDNFSHEIGDFLLIEVSKILKSNVRDLDLVSRYGGDEFVILLKHGEFESSKMISERIHSKILEKKGFRKEIERKVGTEIMLLGKNMLSCSIGIVNYNRSNDIKNVEDLLALADETMYKAKKAGKSRIVVN